MENKRWIACIYCEIYGRWQLASDIKAHQRSFVIFTSHWLHFGAKACVNKSGMSGQEEDRKISISQQTANHFLETMNAASTN